jgi:hypothetical protein
MFGINAFPALAVVTARNAAQLMAGFTDGNTSLDGTRASGWTAVGIAAALAIALLVRGSAGTLSRISLRPGLISVFAGEAAGVLVTASWR